MHSWVRYSVAVYVGLLLAGAAVLPEHADLEREALAQHLTHTGRLYAQPGTMPHIHVTQTSPETQADRKPLEPCHCNLSTELVNP